MVDREKLQERLMATFVDELAEHVESINAGVLTLESAVDESLREQTMGQLFRAAHSLKGASRAVDIPPIEQICHHLEDVFTAVRDGRLKLNASSVSSILSVADCIGVAGTLLRERKPVPAGHFATQTKELERIVADEAATTSPKASVLDDVHAQALPTSVSDGAVADAHPEAPVDSPTTSLTTEPAAPEAPSASTPQRLSGATVRVAEEKLDRLMAQASELLIARQRLELRPEDVEAIAADIAVCRNEYRNIEIDRESSTRFGFATSTSERKLGQGTSVLSATARFEHLVHLAGERLQKLEQQVEEFHRLLLADVRQLTHISEGLQQDIHRIRMLPFSDGCVGLDRAVRDVAVSTGKQVDLKIVGGDIELDRTVLEGLRDPLMHLVRNAVDHGLEPPGDRLIAGKAETGQLTITASIRGSLVDVTISDDGRGLDRSAIQRKLREKGLPEPRDDQELFRSIFLPGFSTATIITDVSGRGVGMDVVKAQLEKLHGTIDLSSHPGLGTRVSLCVPLTLTTIAALLVRAGGQTYALPSTNVSRLLRFRASELRTMAGQSVLSIGDSPIPVMSLTAALKMPDNSAAPGREFLQGAVLTTGDMELIVVVDELIGERDTVVKSLGPQIRRVRYVSGATLDRNGEIALLLNVTTLVRSSSPWKFQHVVKDADVPAVRVKRILVVDDSITTRSMLKSIIEAAGYDVTTAIDGEDAWTKLQGSEFNLVVTDVDMPGLDGFMLTERIRKSDKLNRLPIIVVTSRDSEDDKANGVRVGADAYLVKSHFQQSSVLETIEQLL